MLALDNPRWESLTHAYGSAANIPELLEKLAKETAPSDKYDDEPWFSLWSALCHQGDVYDASYAALPHVVSIAQHAESPIDFSFFQLPAAIEIARCAGRAPEIPVDLEVAYRDALASISDCVAHHCQSAWDQSTLISVMSALSVSKGHVKVAEALMNLDDDIIEKLILLDVD